MPLVSRLIRCVRRVRGFGFAAALLALACQLALGMAVLPDAAASEGLAALDAVGILCAGPPAPGDGTPARHQRHAADLALCPVTVVPAQPAVILASSPVLPTPSAVRVPRSHDRPPGRGPPPPGVRVGAPRAPPVLA